MTNNNQYNLHHFALCPLSRQVRLMAGECNTDLHLIEQKPWQIDEKFFILNPSGELPILVLPDGSNIVTCHAIGEFFSESVADDKNGDKSINMFLPAKNNDRAEVRRLVTWFNHKFYTEVTLPLLENRVYQIFDKSNLDSSVIKISLQSLKLHLQYFDELLQQRDWFVGDKSTWADYAAAGHISMLDYLGDVPWKEYEVLANWYRRFKSRPCFRPLLKDWVPGIAASPSYANLDF